MQVFAIDTSGSMGAELEARVRAFVAKMGDSGDKVLMFDTRIAKVTTVGALPNDQFVGGGGTLIEPVVAWRDQNAPDAHLVVVSDGYFAGKATATNATLALVGDMVTVPSMQPFFPTVIKL